MVVPAGADHRVATVEQEARWIIHRAAKEDRGRLAVAEVEEVDQAAVLAAVVPAGVMEENTVLLEIVCQPPTWLVRPVETVQTEVTMARVMVAVAAEVAPAAMEPSWTAAARQLSPSIR